MNAVDQAKAGVDRASVDERMVGGTFGVAVLGAMVSTLGRSQLDQLLPTCPPQTARAWRADWARAASFMGYPLRSWTRAREPSSTRSSTACA